MRNTIVRSAGVVIALPIAIVAGAIGQAGSREVPAYGIYSNMQASDGDYSGFEFIILPSDEGDFVVLQQAEGWPQKPLLLAARLGGTRATDQNGLQFDHPEMGPFRGVILGDSLVGEFTQMKYQITLLRGQSIWQ